MWLITINNWLFGFFGVKVLTWKENFKYLRFWFLQFFFYLCGIYTLCLISPKITVLLVRWPTPTNLSFVLNIQWILTLKRTYTLHFFLWNLNNDSKYTSNIRDIVCFVDGHHDFFCKLAFFCILIRLSFENS